MAWSKRFLEWTEGYIAKLSVVFTWDLPQVYMRAVWLKQMGYDVIAGGPAVKLIPNYLKDVAKIEECESTALNRHNPLATFTSRGCIRQCPFCAVPKVEGDFIELDDWLLRPVLCDNNLLAASQKHFDKVIDQFKTLKNIDIQNIDARLITDYHAERLAELDCKVMRLGFDNVNYENKFLAGYERLRKEKIPKSRIRAYVLIGYNDTPEDALYRLRLVHNLGIQPNPMWYNPLDSLVRDSYVAPGWTDKELTRYVRYWANLRYFGGVPFEDFR